MSVGRGFNTPSSTKTAIKDEITSNLRAGTPHTSRGKYIDHIAVLMGLTGFDSAKK